METWPALVAGIGSGLVGGFYLAFSLVVMPALRRLPGGAAASAMGLATTSLVGELTPGGAERIAGGVGPTEDEEEALDWAAMEFGTD